MIARDDVINQHDIDRFWSKVNKDGIKKEHMESCCWEWTAGLKPEGYGEFSVKYKNYYAHRFSWIISHGEILNGLFVCHLCDQKNCVRPDHLYLGTNEDNQKDASQKGLSAFGKRNGQYTHPEKVRVGENHPRAVLTEIEVLEIRRLNKEEGKKAPELSKIFATKRENIRNIIAGKIWKYLLPKKGDSDEDS